MWIRSWNNRHLIRGAGAESDPRLHPERFFHQILAHFRPGIAFAAAHMRVFLARNLLKRLLSQLNRSVSGMRTKDVLGQRKKARMAMAGDTQVFVVEDSGKLVAIVVDKQRGITRIPLGALATQRTFTSCTQG
jgi:hypothetical protein